MPKLREGSYLADWVMPPRKRLEQALVPTIADTHLVGVRTDLVDRRVQTL